MPRERASTLSHERVWAAIDMFAARQGMTPSGLARRAGLDSTTFNRSKRLGGDGRPRWPSTESIAKILDATGAGPEAFFSLLADPDNEPLPPVRTVPFLDAREAGAPGFFDEGGRPTGPGWDAVAFPSVPREVLYALEVAGPGLSALYREGDVIIVSPTMEIRRGDRVVVRLKAGDLLARTFVRRTTKLLELGAVDPEQPERLDLAGVDWVARIVWASQ